MTVNISTNFKCMRFVDKWPRYFREVVQRCEETDNGQTSDIWMTDRQVITIKTFGSGKLQRYIKDTASLVPISVTQMLKNGLDNCIPLK